MHCEQRLNLLVVSLRLNDQGQGPLSHRSGRYVQDIQVDASAHSPELIVFTSGKIQELDAPSTFEVTTVGLQNPGHVPRGFVKPLSSTRNLYLQNHAAQVIVECNSSPVLQMGRGQVGL